MLKRNLWKLTLSLAIVVWAISSLLPLKDREFDEYAQAQASAQSAEFAALIRESSERVTSGEAPSVFMALKQIAVERKLDLARFFPDLNLGDVRNIERRNAILLDHLLKESRGRLQLGLDLKGGVAFTLEVDDPRISDEPIEAREEKLAKAIEILGDRLNGLGVAEPIIRPIGENRIEVQLPGVNTKDNPEVVDSVKKPARLDFRLVHTTLSPEMVPPGEIPPGYEIMALENESRTTGEIVAQELFVKRIPEMTGEGVSDSFPTMDEYGRFRIILRFTSEGSQRFAEVTGSIAQENQRTGRVGQLAIVLDGKLYSAPTVREQINSDSAEISGSFSQREAFDLANVLNNPLDLPLQIVEQYEIGPSLAADAVASGRLAFIMGISFTAIFIMVFYSLGGVLAVAAMTINVLLVLGVMASIGATLSMPGIAGIVLTIGMSVDSNILIFERIREELKLGKSLPTAFEAGFEKAFSAILDGNLTTLITAGIMIALGTGPVKGFGVTLAIGIFSTMFSALVVSRMLLDWAINSGAMKRFRMFTILDNTSYRFIKHARPAFITSWIIVLIGITTVFYKGSAIYGIDFTGGDQVALSFDERLDIADIRQVATNAGITDISLTYTQEIGSDREILRITTPFDLAGPLVGTLQQAHPGAGFDLVSESRIGPSVGAEIRSNAGWAIFWSLVLILLYVAFRFEFGYGIGAVVATMHDLLMTIGIFVLFDRQFNASMVAAILLIVGYSINDTIVVFDRIREELKLDPNGSLRTIIDRALNLTLSRTIITGGTTFITAIVLFTVAGGAINDLALTLMIGVVVGTFSSLFIACPVFYWWHKGDRKRVEKHHDVAPTYEWTGSSKASE